METRKFNGPHKALSEFRNCFEGGMDFETALACSGLSDKGAETIAMLRRWWSTLEAKAA